MSRTQLTSSRLIATSRISSSNRLQINDFGYSGLFNSVDNYVDCGSNLDTIANFTITAWINPILIGIRRIITKLGNSSGDFQILFNGSNQLSFLRYTGISNNYQLWSNSIFIVPKKWIHISMVYTSGAGNNAKIYINGISGTDTLTTGTNTAASQNFYIGKGGASNLYLGWIDNVRFYNTILDSSQINQLYLCENCPSPTNLKGYWKFNENTGGTIADSSGNNNTGTWNGTGTYWSNEVPMKLRLTA